MAKTNIININKQLLAFSDNPIDIWTIDDAIKGISIMGGTGSGKTSASGRRIALSFLKEGWGGLVLCAKTDEAQLWWDYCKEAGRGDDLIMFYKGAKHLDGDYKGEDIVFNPIDYEMKRAGDGAGETQNLTNIFMNIYRMGNRIANEGDTREERYWDTALKRCLNRVIELIKLAGEDLSYINMVKVLSTCDSAEWRFFEDILNRLKEKEDDQQQLEELANEINVDLSRPSEYCLRCLYLAYCNSFDEDASEANAHAFNLVQDYFCNVLPRMDDKTRAIVTESFMGLAEPFLSGLLFKHFAGRTNIFPEETYTKNKIIVLDFAIKEYLDAGIIAQSLFKLLFQQAVERRNINEHPSPVFLWCDEAQYFVNPYDQIFLTTARSSRTATVFLSQNISNYFAVMGSGSDAKARVDSLMGNLCTKIFHANSDAETNEYASRLIGNALSSLANSTEQHSPIGLSSGFSEGLTSQYLPQVQPREFTVLKTGGAANEYKANAVVVVSGKQWANKKNYIKASFSQNFKTNYASTF